MKDRATPEQPDRPRPVLVVDDQPANRLLLRDLLELDGHDVIEADNGVDALRLAVEHDPDVVLLDVTMPGMDGFEVCRRLRALPATAATPVLLVTALNEREHRLRGVAAGANDYLVKPIDHSEVSLRVRNAAHMRAVHRTVARQYHALQRLEQLRDDLVAMIAHDLRSPLTGLRGSLELLQDGLADPAEAGELLAGAIHAVDRLNGMIGDMLDVSRMEADALPLRRQATPIHDIVTRAISAVGPRPTFHPVTVVVTGDAVTIDADPQLLLRVVINLLANAIRFSPANGEVRITIAADTGGVVVRICDQGPGVPDGEQQEIFEKFRQVSGPHTSSRAHSSGLGLTFCRMAIDRHGGRIGVTSTAGAGSEFWFWLP